MHGNVAKLIDRAGMSIHENSPISVGSIVRITDEGKAFVEFPGNQRGPVMARSAIPNVANAYIHTAINIPVILMFEGGDPELPVIMGLIHETLYPENTIKKRTIRMDGRRETEIDGNKIFIDAKREIVLRCGKSSIALKKDGKVVIKGVEITSRAAGKNKIKGAAVNIN